MNVDPACILSLCFPRFISYWDASPGRRWVSRRWSSRFPGLVDGDVGVGSDRWDRKIHRRLKDKGKMANKTVGRAWNRQSITTWAHHVAGEIKSTEPLDMRGN